MAYQVVGRVMAYQANDG